MTLIHLPNEIVLAVASYLPHVRDIYALMRTSRDLYNSLHWFLYHFESQHNHARALHFAVRHNCPSQVKALLDGLLFARRNPYQHALSMPCRQLHDELGLYDPVTPSMSIRPYRPDLPDFYANGFGGSIQFTTYPCYCFLHSDDFWGTVSAHPLHQRNYTIRSIFNIQRSLILAIRNKNSIIVKLLLDHGAQTNFYLGPNFLFLLPEATRKWWVWQSLKLPPLCVAVQSKDLQLVNLLLEHGANPQIEWPSGLYRTVEHTLNMIDVLLKWPEMQSQEESLSDSILTQLRTVRSAGMFTIATAHGIECYRSMALHSVQRKAYYDLVDLLRSRGATSAQLHDVNTKFMRENIDGTLSIFIFEIFDTYFQTDNGLDEATEKAVANTASQT